MAKLKSKDIAEKHTDFTVIGSDTIVVINNEILNKPGNKENAIFSLKKLSGNTHYQNCGMAICLNGKIVWQSFAIAELTMKPLSLDQIEEYVELDKPFNCSGSYKFESHGKDLFSNVKGSEYTIQGLDIDQLLDILIEEGIINE